MKRQNLISSSDIQKLAAMFPMYASKHVSNTCRKTLKRCPLNRHELIFALSVSALFAPGDKPNFVKRCNIIADFFSSNRNVFELSELLQYCQAKEDGSEKKSRKNKKAIYENMD